MAEKKCRYCAMMIPGDARICPHCRKPQGWTIPAKIFATLLAVVIFGAIMSTFNSIPKKTSYTTIKQEGIINKTGTAGLGIARRKIINNEAYKEMGFHFKRGSDIENKPNYVGSAKNILATIQLVGQEANLDQINVLMVLSPSSKRNFVSMATMVSVANLIDRPSGDWVTQEIVNIVKLQQYSKESYANEKVFGYRKFKINAVDSMIILTINKA